MIDIKNLRTVFKKTEILHDVSFSAQGGELIALVGPNGAGKTTLIKHLNGLIKPAAGSVTICGFDTRKTKTSALARLAGFLFQNPDQQILCATVRDEICFGLKHCGIPKNEWDERIRTSADMTDLAGKLDSDPLLLTRSRRQRVALASVLATDPQILILDEPTSAQDEAETCRIMNMAQRLAGKGKLVILVSHDMELVARYATRVLVLINGTLEKDCTPSELFNDQKLLDRACLNRPGIFRLSDELGISVNDGASILFLADQIGRRLKEAAV